MHKQKERHHADVRLVVVSESLVATQTRKKFSLDCDTPRSHEAEDANTRTVEVTAAVLKKQPGAALSTAHGQPLASADVSLCHQTADGKQQMADGRWQILMQTRRGEDLVSLQSSGIVVAVDGPRCHETTGKPFDCSSTHWAVGGLHVHPKGSD